jgi:methyl-accepting chemotaxis protein
MNANYSYALNNYGFTQGQIGLFNAEFNNSQAIIKDVILYSETMDTYTEKLSQTNSKIDTYMTNMRKSMVNQKEISTFNSIKDNLKQYTSVANQVTSLVKKNNIAEAQTLLTMQGDPLSDKISESIQSLINQNTTEGQKITQQLTSEARLAYFVMIIIIILQNVGKVYRIRCSYFDK